MADSDSRFAHLLQPIRDLADNWNIDIARELEDYLTELESITFSFDGHQNSLNFAEAALVIQGSAVVYSKKVEYLYTLLYQTLDFLIEKRQKKTQEGGATEGNNENVVEGEPDFLSLDDVIEEGKGIDLVEGRESTSTPIRISLPPLAMAFVSDIADPNIDNTNKSENPTGLRRTDYRMNTAMIHRSGALVLDEAALLDDDLQSLASSSTTNTPYATPKNLNQTQLNQSIINQAGNQSVLSDKGGITGGIEVPRMVDSDDEDNAGDDDDDEEDGKGSTSVIGQLAASTRSSVADLASSKLSTTSSTSQQQGEKISKKSKSKKRVAFDLWAMLDPHEEVGSTKAFKRGKPYRVRQNTKLPPTPDAVVPILSIAETSQPFRGLRGPDFSEFAYLYAAELKRRRDVKKKDKYEEFTFDEAEPTAEEDEAEEAQYFTADLGASFNGASGFGGVVAVEFNGGAADEVPTGDVDDDDDVDTGDAGDFGIFASMDDDSGDTQTYMDLCRNHVEKFLSEADQYAQETNLSRRVNDWKSKLAPFLAEQESHPNFDMLEYGGSLIGLLKDEYENKPGVVISDQGEVQAEDDFVVSFAKLTVGAERYEVARRFAAVLQLVNNGNVTIETTHEVDSLSFHLLSIKPKFDIENYRAPSLNLLPAEEPEITEGKKKEPKAKRGSKKTEDGEAKKRKDDEKEEGTKKTTGKRAKTTKDNKDEEKEEEASKKKKSAEVVEDKENRQNGRETRSKRKVRGAEEEEESLKGPRTRMFEVEV